MEGWIGGHWGRVLTSLMGIVATLPKTKMGTLPQASLYHMAWTCLRPPRCGLQVGTLALRGHSEAVWAGRL